MLILFILMITINFITALIQYYFIEHKYINKIQEIYDNTKTGLYSYQQCQYDLWWLLND